MLVSVEQVKKIYNGRAVLDGVDLRIEDTDRIGLIGVNGCGKSTLLRLLMGEEQPDEGEISIRSGLSIGYLAQNSGLERDRTILEELRSVFGEVLALEQELRRLEAEMAQNQAAHDALAEAYAKKLTEFESRDGYLIDVKINTVLQGMGFADRPGDTPIHVLSGGEKTRLAMAKLLLEEPQLLVLDEPTNHLDFKTLTWLEEYLQGYQYAMLIVSHDRYFLNKLVTSVCEIERTRLTRYKGNYTKFVQLKAERRQRQQKEYEQQQKEIAALEEYVEKNLVRASTTKMAQSRRHKLETMERIERPVGEQKSAHFHFNYDRDPFKELLQVEELALAVGSPSKIICRNIRLDIKRGEKVAFIGANGVGKTTLLKTLQGLLQPAAGHYTWSPHVHISYYDQEMTGLHPDKLVIDELWDRFRYMKEVEVRAQLGAVLLTGDNVYKQVGVISGGEKAKLMFAIMALERGNVLILDEPTNHLDMATREVLEEALREYPGSILMVSHDRYFLNQVADHIVEMYPDHLEVYEGNYDAYLERRALLEARAAAQAQAKSEPAETSERQGAGNYRTKAQKNEEARRRQMLREVEQEIAEAEDRLKQLESSVNDPEVYENYTRMREVLEETEAVKRRHDELFDQWVELSE